MQATNATSPMNPRWATRLATCGLLLCVFPAAATAAKPAAAPTATPASSSPAADAPAGCPAPKKEPPFDINSASALDLRCGLGPNGLSEAAANKIVDNRPYATVDELLDRKVLNSTMFLKIQSRVTASPPAAKSK